MESNSSHYFPVWLRYYGLSSSFILIFVCLVGIFGNCLSITIFLKERFRQHSINVFLAAMSISDLCELILAIPVFASAPLLNYWGKWQFIQYVYSYSAVYLYPAVTSFHFCSIWLLIAVSFERWIGVCKPLLSITYCTRKRALIMILIIFISSISYNSVGFLEFRLSNYSYKAITALRASPHYKLWYRTVSYLFIVYLIPLITLVNFNVRIARQIQRSYSKRRAMSATQKENRSTATMLLWLVFSFICCYTPSFILNAIEAIWPAFYRTVWGYVLCDGNNIVAVLNAASTFIFYLTYSTQYRWTAVSLLCCCLSKSHREDLKQIEIQLSTSPSITVSRYSLNRRHHSVVSMYGGIPTVEIRRSSYSPLRSPAFARAVRYSESVNMCLLGTADERQRLMIAKPEDGCRKVSAPQ